MPLGRRSECATLARLLDAVREGESRTLVLLLVALDKRDVR